MTHSSEQVISPLGQAIYCNCYNAQYRHYKILGSVTIQGLIEILRPHKEKTIIEAQELMIVCSDCKFKRYIKIESTAVNRPARYENH